MEREDGQCRRNEGKERAARNGEENEGAYRNRFAS